MDFSIANWGGWQFAFVVVAVVVPISIILFMLDSIMESIVASMKRRFRLLVHKIVSWIKMRFV